MQILKWFFAIAIMCVIVYTFRGSAGAIVKELKETTVAVAAGICAMTIVYQLIEGWITTLLVRQYNPSFGFRLGVTNAFLCSFYRVATLGSGAGIAAIVYLGEHDVEYSKGFGIYMMQYVMHKISIAFFSMILFGLNWSYMFGHFEDYTWMLTIGYGITALISFGLVLFCCSGRVHRWILGLLGIVNKKSRGRLDDAVQKLQRQCGMLEDTAKDLLIKRRLLAGVIVLDLVKFCFWYGIPYLVFAADRIITMPQTMAVTSLSVMLAAVMPAPAGIGSTEFVFMTLFSDIVGMGPAGSAAILYRFGTFVFPFLVGGIIVIARRIFRKA